jgi:hypothetical protein
MTTPDGVYNLVRIASADGRVEYVSTPWTPAGGSSRTRKVHILFVERQAGALEYDVYYTRRTSGGRGVFHGDGVTSQVWTPASN